MDRGQTAGGCSAEAKGETIRLTHCRRRLVRSMLRFEIEYLNSILCRIFRVSKVLLIVLFFKHSKLKSIARHSKHFPLYCGVRLLLSKNVSYQDLHPNRINILIYRFARPSRQNHAQVTRSQKLRYGPTTFQLQQERVYLCKSLNRKHKSRSLSRKTLFASIPPHP